MAYSILQFQKITNGKLQGRYSNELNIKHLYTDSRQVYFPASTCFFAIKSTRRDGHNYIAELYNRGVRSFIVSNSIDVNTFPEAAFLFVKDVITALQKIAAFHRSKFTIPVTGITGSNGKTIVKEWLFQMVREDHVVAKSPGSYNSQIGVPLSVWQLDQNHRLGIFEAGISRVGEMHKLSEIIQCNVGILVNLGSAHDAGFQNRQQKLTEKLTLFTSANALIYRLDGGLDLDTIDRHLPHTVERITWSLKTSDIGKANLAITSIALHSERHQTILEGIWKKEPVSIYLPFDHPADIENAMHCVVWMLYHGYNMQTINERLGKLERIPMRLELQKGVRNTLILNDAYSSDAESFMSAIDFIRQQASGKPIGIILTDLEQQTSESEWLELIAEVVVTHQVKLFIGVGTSIVNLVSRLQMSGIRTFFFSGTTELSHNLHDLPLDGYALLCKGARSYKLENIISQLIAQSHAAVLEINLNKLAHNFSLYTSALASDTEVMIMLKAFAYGSGDLELARFFESAGVSWFGVAFIDEGIKLRQGGIQTPILVLSPDPGAIHLCLTHRLEPEIYSIDQLHEILSFLNPDDTLNIHIKLDTGMHRLGLELHDIPTVVEQLKKSPGVKVVSVMTHMANTSETGNDSFVHIQMQRFHEMYASLVSGIGYRPLRHAMNSDGIINFPEYHFELVRLGIGLYGISGITSHGLTEEPVHTLKARVVQMKEIQRGESVGYNRNWIAKEWSKIATINIGYADGLPRKAGNGRTMLMVRDKLAPIIGNVCMDMCMIDVTHIPEVKTGDEVIIFSKEHSVQKLAEACETIPYEILSGISSRISRLYLRD